MYSGNFLRAINDPQSNIPQFLLLLDPLQHQVRSRLAITIPAVDSCVNAQSLRLWQRGTPFPFLIQAITLTTMVALLDSKDCGFLQILVVASPILLIFMAAWPTGMPASKYGDVCATMTAVRSATSSPSSWLPFDECYDGSCWLCCD